MNSLAPRRDIFSVSRLNSEVRAVLAGSFPLLWVEGEISNLARPSSGHLYFTLKDATAQVRCAMFRMKATYLRFQPENGQRVIVRARVGLYEPRGDFQLTVEQMEPSGEGDLQRAFEELKRKLDAEGLFDPAHKKPIPAFPQRIGLITSPSGAAVRDVITVLRRRCPGIPVLIYPTQVQGDAAPAEMVEALRLAEQRAECDLLILTRGGGSLEDLAAFNDERLARTIHRCAIPLISAVGHEIDFTIADFVADQRAPTPSAAAEMASPDRYELEARLERLRQRLASRMNQRMALLRTQLQALGHRHTRLDPRQTLQRQAQRVDELELRLRRAMERQLTARGHRLAALDGRLQLHSPARALPLFNQKIDQLDHRLRRAAKSLLDARRQSLNAAGQQLHTLSPLATLERGYSITLRVSNGTILRDAGQVKLGDRIETRLGRGSIKSLVEELESGQP